MPNDYNIVYALGLIAGSATFLRASLQPKATVFDRFCDGAALLCLALLGGLSTRLIAGAAP
jgi:hypothetical protein